MKTLGIRSAVKLADRERVGKGQAGATGGAGMRILVSIVCWVTAALCASVSGPTSDYLEPKRLTGSIYDKEGGRLLFTFLRTSTNTGNGIYVLREFRSPDMSVAARERVVYGQGRLARFELDELQVGANGRATIESLPDKQRRIDFQYTIGTGQDAKVKHKVETVREEALISDSLPVFLANHFDELNGDAV